MSLYQPDSSAQYAKLTIKDLLDAREAYHRHLVSVDDNIVATAIGRYRFKKQPGEGPRTFANSEVLPESWPCVLVFIRKWRELAEFAPNQNDKDQFVRYVPPKLYLPDGRVVPTCVIELSDQERAEAPDLGDFHSRMLGGGYPLRTSEQGRIHEGTMACLVTDGSSTYALTCRHVAGEAGRPVYSVVGQDPIGTSYRVYRGKRRFSEVYPDWPGKHVFLNVDAGLVKLHDLNHVTAQVLGIKKMGPIVNAAPELISIDWIGQRVFGFGAATKWTEGELAAFFFRYRAVGGFEYVADVLIAPSPDARVPLHSVPGNSGQLFFVDGKDGVACPLAMQWGGYQSIENQRVWQFVLGTFVSTICRELDVDIVRNYNAGLFEYWGAGVHRNLSNVMLNFVGADKLTELLTNNEANLAYLAPVPDEWLYKKGLKRHDTGAEGSYHFTDYDQAAVRGDYQGKTLLEIWKNPSLITKDVFGRYVQGLPAEKSSSGRTRPPPASTLAFRAAFIYEQMIEFLKAGKAAEFLAAVGILAHYIEDSCCSLHLSYMHHGDPDADDFALMAKNQKDIHGSYDWVKAGRKPNLEAELAKSLGDFTAGGGGIKTPGDVARRVVQLQRTVYEILSPADLIQMFRDAGYKFRWEDIGEATIASMTEGIKLLTEIITAAWKHGHGDRAIDTAEVPRRRIEELCADPDFLPSAMDYDPAEESHHDDGNGKAKPRTAPHRPARHRTGIVAG